MVIHTFQHVWGLNKVKDVKFYNNPGTWELKKKKKRFFFGWDSGVSRWVPGHPAEAVMRQAGTKLSCSASFLREGPWIIGLFPRYCTNCLAVWHIEKWIQICVLMNACSLNMHLFITLWQWLFFPRKKCFWFTYVWLMHEVGFINHYFIITKKCPLAILKRAHDKEPIKLNGKAIKPSVHLT